MTLAEPRADPDLACHEEDHDLPHLKALKEAAAKKK